MPKTSIPSTDAKLAQQRAKLARKRSKARALAKAKAKAAAEAESKPRLTPWNTMCNYANCHLKFGEPCTRVCVPQLQQAVDAQPNMDALKPLVPDFALCDGTTFHAYLDTPGMTLSRVLDCPLWVSAPDTTGDHPSSCAGCAAVRRHHLLLVKSMPKRGKFTPKRCSCSGCMI